MACPECDLLLRLPGLPPGGKARCPRCGDTLATCPADPVDRPLALALAAAIVFIVAHTTPLMGLSAVGRRASTTIAGGALEMWQTGEPITAIIVSFCAGIAPGAYIDTFTVALVQLQPLMSVEPGPGVLFFAAVVVLTMIAAESFDPRLIWDSRSGVQGHHA